MLLTAMFQDACGKLPTLDPDPTAGPTEIAQALIRIFQTLRALSSNSQTNAALDHGLRQLKALYSLANNSVFFVLNWSSVKVHRREARRAS
jgi:hypothetical protein